ncbi:hypothetical protein SBA5_30170 [Candidatus Sulfotelmatomonas gaucii]|uniref:Uncharacterized protein n=1 Tax=Candidatus Sulfuritelmatomonas gaucii TaxID=2043161 RepID=A0A2N9LD67_9BACT|nr:hypothetical protein SBA5_30170 [Candidatus Sulfotelmatomonas gaucii]
MDGDEAAKADALKHGKGAMKKVLNQIAQNLRAAHRRSFKLKAKS